MSIFLGYPRFKSVCLARAMTLGELATHHSGFTCTQPACINHSPGWAGEIARVAATNAFMAYPEMRED